MGVGEAQGRGKGIYWGKGVSVGLFLQVASTLWVG